MKKSFYILMLAAVLGLAACGDKKDKDSEDDEFDSLTKVESAEIVA